MNNSQIKQALKNAGVKNYSTLNRMELLILASKHFKNEPIWKSLLNQEQQKQKHKQQMNNEDLKVQHGGSELDRLNNPEFINVYNNNKKALITALTQLETYLEKKSYQEDTFLEEKTYLEKNIFKKNTVKKFTGKNKQLIAIAIKMGKEFLKEIYNDVSVKKIHVLPKKFATINNEQDVEGRTKNFFGEIFELNQPKEGETTYRNAVYMILYVLLNALYGSRGGISTLKTRIKDVKNELEQISNPQPSKIQTKIANFLRRKKDKNTPSAVAAATTVTKSSADLSEKGQKFIKCLQELVKDPKA